MKYWVLTTEFTPVKNDGIGAFVYQHAKIFADKGHDVLIILGSAENAAPVTNISTNITLHSFSLKGRSSARFLGYNAALSYEFANEVITLLANDTPDIIEVQEYLGIGYYLLLRKYAGEPLLQNIPVIVTAHMPSFLSCEFELDVPYRFPQYWTGEMERFSLLAADLLISPCNHLIQSLKERMHESFPEKVVTIPYPLGINDNISRPEIQRKTFVVLGNMQKSKGILNLLQAADRLWKKGLDFHIKLAGNSDYYINTEGQTIGTFIRNKYAHYITTGKLHVEENATPNAIKNFLPAAHAIIVPSLTSNLSYATIEAMAAGKVVLASATSGDADLINDGVTGFIFNWYEAGHFEQKLTAVLSLTNDQLQHIGTNATAAIEVCYPENYYSTKYRIVTNLIQSYQLPNRFPVIRPQTKPAGSNPIKLHEGLTVAIPYYNMGEYIQDCVDSVYQSSYKHIRVIIVDDGSTDEMSIAKLTHLKNKYPEIKILRQENAGLSAARNTGLKNADTRYITFLDADDTVHVNYFSKALDLLNRYENISFVSCWLKYFGAEQGIWPGQNPEVPYLLYHNTVHSGCVFNTKDILQTGGYDKTLIYGMEDYEMAVNMVSRGFHGVCIPEALYNYRIRKQSMARGFTTEKKLFLYSLITLKHKNLFDKYGNECVNIINANGPGYLHDNPTFATRFAVQQVTPRSLWKTVASEILDKYPKLRKLTSFTGKLLAKIF